MYRERSRELFLGSQKLGKVFGRSNFKFYWFYGGILLLLLLLLLFYFAGVRASLASHLRHLFLHKMLKSL
jgi:hypothetical protein